MEFDKYLRLQEAHHQDLLRQAEQYRLVQLALAGKPRRPSLQAWLMNWLGSLITNLICFLQSQFGKRAQKSTVAPYQSPCRERV